MEPTQPTIQQPVQSSPEVITPQPKQNYLKTIIFSILVIITLSLIIYLIFQNQKLQKQVLNPPVSPTVQVQSPTSTPTLTSTPQTVSSISIPPDETAGWKTYVNTKYNYSVKYPSNWFLYDKGLYWPNEKIYKNEKEIVFISPKQKEDLLPGGFSITDEFLIQGNLGAFIESDILLDRYKVEKASINNILTTKVTTATMPDYGGFATTYYFEVNNINYIIAFPNQNLNGAHSPIFDQILSTFKFTDKQCPEGQYARQCKRGPCCCPVGAICD
jgi:hypothetical protein